MPLIDPRLEQVAEILTGYCTDIQAGEYVYLWCSPIEGLPLYQAVRREVIRKGAIPHDHFAFDPLAGYGIADHDWLTLATPEMINDLSKIKLAEMEAMDAYIGIGGTNNLTSLSDIPASVISERNSATWGIIEERLKKKWVITKYPTAGAAQKAGMATEEFEDFSLGAIIDTDWPEVSALNKRIMEIFDGAEEVQIIGDGTDLSFSLTGREGDNDDGHYNMPDGEVAYAPIHTTLNGTIAFTYPGVSGGNEVPGIVLTFKDGKVVDAKASGNEAFLHSMLDTDEGSRYVGEYGIGTNKGISRFTGMTLFDEKIGGSIHLALGFALEDWVKPDDPHGRNTSGIHWDIVKDLRPEYGGGEIRVNGEIVQKNGIWRFKDASSADIERPAHS